MSTRLSFTKLLALIAISACLVACEIVEEGELVGSWQDAEAALVTCGDSFTQAVGLEIREDAELLRGTFTIGDNDLPFVGTRTGRTIKGDVNNAEKEIFLVAVLAYTSGNLRGEFETTFEKDCAAGGKSTTVYKVKMNRSRLPRGSSLPLEP
mgnify:CR=1 FL=1